MYLSDLSLHPYKYSPLEEGIVVLSVGWLDNSHEYEQGEVSSVFLERLWRFCPELLIGKMGYHRCPFCVHPAYPIRVRWGAEEIPLGSAETRIFGSGNKVYASPNLIYHYVSQHHYRPPAEFIQAVLSCPLPGSPEYDARIKTYGWDEV